MLGKRKIVFVCTSNALNRSEGKLKPSVINWPVLTNRERPRNRFIYKRAIVRRARRRTAINSGGVRTNLGGLRGNKHPIPVQFFLIPSSL
jgi:hypothetical protein